MEAHTTVRKPMHMIRNLRRLLRSLTTACGCVTDRIDDASNAVTDDHVQMLNVNTFYLEVLHTMSRRAEDRLTRF